jgi:hypothetical protein
MNTGNGQLAHYDEDRDWIPQVQVRSKGLVAYSIPHPPYSHKRHELQRHKTYSGTVTDHAANRIKRTVDVFLQRSPERTIWNTATNQQNQFRAAFCTLTIPDEKEVDGKEAYKGLKVFLDHFRKPQTKKALSEQLRSYIWKAELQKRGQIHYHITTNSFLNLWEVRRVWNGVCFRRGWMRDYILRYGNTNPNSTDIHAVYKVNDLQAYLSKYLSKNGRTDVSEYGFSVPIFEPTINGKVWDASRDIKVPRFSYELDEDTYLRIGEGRMAGEIKVVQQDRCQILYADNPTAYMGEEAFLQYVDWKNK